MERGSWAWVLAAGLLGACGDQDVALDSGGPESEGGGVDDGEEPDPGGGTIGGDDPGGGTSGGVEPEDLSCASSHRAPDDPSILIDADLACTHSMFARYGVSAVATAASDAVVLATAGFEQSWVFRVDASTVEEIAGTPRLTQQRTLLALDAEDTLVYAGMMDDHTIAVSRFTDRWEVQLLELEAARVLDLASSSNGSTTLWLQDLEAGWGAARWTDGAWTVDTATVPEGAVAPRFTLAADGSEVALAHVPAHAPDTWRLAASIGGETTMSFGDVSDAAPSACVPVHTSAAEELPAAVAPFVGVSARADALVLDSPSSPDASLALPDTFARDSSCPVADDACLPECHDVSAGRLDDAFATARGEDGTVWVGWVHADVDRRLTYVESCDVDECWCDEVIVDDRSTYTLRVVAVYADGTIAPVLAVPLADDPCGDRFIAPGDALDLHAHGSRLAIAVRTAKSDVLPGAELFTLRTILLDTTAFATPPAPAEPGGGD